MSVYIFNEAKIRLEQTEHQKTNIPSIFDVKHVVPGHHWTFIPERTSRWSKRYQTRESKTKGVVNVPWIALLNWAEREKHHQSISEQHCTAFSRQVEFSRITSDKPKIVSTTLRKLSVKRMNLVQTAERLHFLYRQSCCRYLQSDHRDRASVKKYEVSLKCVWNNVVSSVYFLCLEVVSFAVEGQGWDHGQETWQRVNTSQLYTSLTQ